MTESPAGKLAALAPGREPQQRGSRLARGASLAAIPSARDAVVDLPVIQQPDVGDQKPDVGDQDQKPGTGDRSPDTGHRTPGKARQAGATRAGAARAEPEVEAWNRKKTVHVPALVKDELRRRCHAAGMSYADYVLDAFDRHWDDLAAWFPAPPPRTSPLPVRRPGRRSKVPSLTPVHLLVDRDEWTPIEGRAAELRVGSISELVSTVLEHDFDLSLDYRRPWRGDV